MTKRKRLSNETESNECEYEDITTVENNIYFYCDVSRETVLKLNTMLNKLSNDVKNNKLSNQYDHINLYIMSDGGELYAGLSAMNYISNMDIHINTIIDGFVASAASLIALGGHEVWMQKHSMLLIHQLSTGFSGKYQEFKDENKNNKLVMKILKNIYLSKTKIPKKILKQYFSRDIHLDSETCLKYNIVNGVF